MSHPTTTPSNEAVLNALRTVHDPDLSTISSASVDAWMRPAERVRNPLLRSRYADLVWDLQRKLDPSKGRSYQFAQTAADAYLELASSNAQQVTKIRRIAEELGHSIATPAEAREMLALKGGDRTGF